MPSAALPPPVATSPVRAAARTAPGSLRRWARGIGPAEVVIGVLLLLAGVALHWQQRGMAGGLWRDEAITAQVANLPTLANTWSYMEFESFPILIHLVVRSWSALFTASDASLRTLGCLIGLGIIAASWLSARSLGVRVPLFTLALLGLNPLMIRYGDSMRAYGLGCCLAVPAAAAIWHLALAERPTRRHVLIAVLAGIISVQALYHNAGLLLASCVGGGVVALWRRRWSLAAVVLATGIPAALSLLPYVPALRRAGQWNVLFKYHVTAAWLWKRLCEVTGSPDPLGVWLWTLLFFGALGLVIWRVRQARRDSAPPAPETQLQTAAAVALIVSTAAYGFFLYLVSYITQPWYYISFLTMVAFCLDMILGQPGAKAVRVTRLLLVFSFGLLTYQQSAQLLKVRQTNMDLVMARIDAEVRPGDLVVINRWECGISGQWYYHGAAPMMTVPPLPDHNCHRYDLVMTTMKSPDPLRPLFESMEHTLRGGGHVWLIGEPVRSVPGQPSPVLPLARPDAKGNWRAGMYYTGWAVQVGDFIIDHCTRASFPVVSPRQPVSPFENLKLTCLSGWQEKPK